MSEQNDEHEAGQPAPGERGSEEEGGGRRGRKLGQTIIIIVLILVAAVLVFAFAGTRKGGEDESATGTPDISLTPIIEDNGNDAPSAPDTEVVNEPTEEPESIPRDKIHAVIYTDAGFSPSPLIIPVGDYILFNNASSRPTRPASAFHPTHTVYPGSDINKCGAAEAEGIFDACHSLENGEEWTFQFNESGEWNYHDHLNPNFTGTIIVE